uniref:hypothetical protein n=1 Tax=Alistipes shahii TaxID=328814 RepID=UPI003FF1510B
IVAYILRHFNQKTKRAAKSYEFHVVTNISEVASAGRRNKVEEVKRRKLSSIGQILVPRNG